MGIVSFLFSFKGRIGRLAYILSAISWLAFTVMLLLAIGIEVPKMTEAGQPPAMPQPGLGASLLITTLSLVSLWSSWALGAKRLHDLNKTGWWLGAGFAGCVVSSLLAFVLPPLGFLGLIGSGLLSLWVCIQMIFFKGDQGPNDYGRPPTVMKDILGDEATNDREPEWAKSAMGTASTARLAAPAAAKPAAKAAAATTTVTRVARSPKMVGVPGGAAPVGFGRRNT
jgi:uncharacterized membrane protein YhaH (DUF805 family)